MQGKKGDTKAGPAIYVRLPVETVEELDEWVVEVRASVPGGSGISRSDMIRDLVIKALEERRGARKGRGKR